MEEAHKIFTKAPFLLETLTNPVVSEEAKEVVLDKIARQSGMPELLENFMKMMCRIGEIGQITDIFTADLDDRLGCAAKRACGIDHVVKQDAGLALDIADDVHDLGLICSLAALVDDSHVAAELEGEVAGSCSAADIGGNDHDILVALAVDIKIVLCKKRCAEKIVDRNVEEALDLGSVQVHREDAVCTGSGNEI